jgi:hypothetical protein
LYLDLGGQLKTGPKSGKAKLSQTPYCTSGGKRQELIKENLTIFWI